MGLLNDKIAVVSGACRGIGWAIVNTFVEHGAHVIGIGRSDPPIHASWLNADAFTFVRGDLTAQTTIERVAEVAESAYGRVDILVNNAAIVTPTPGPVDAISDSDWERVLQINLLSVVKLSARLLPLMRSARCGRIINLGSVLSMHGAAHGGPYVVSKHAVLGLTRTQALEYGSIGITANCLLPGPIDTEMWREGDSDGAFRRYVESRSPLGRMADPREIAAAALFLASPLASYVNGHALVVDGGVSVRL